MPAEGDAGGNDADAEPLSHPRGQSAPAILVTDDDREMCELAEAALGGRGYEVKCCLTPEEALAALTERDFAAFLVDINLEGRSGLDLCRAALAKRPDLVVVVMTGFGTIDHAIGAMRAGAYDFVTKPASMDMLALAMDRAVRHRAMIDELSRLRRSVALPVLANVVGESPAIRRMADVVARVAPTHASVLVTGESGTGKELVARALHERSGRRGPFLAISCAALPDTLLEAELFGHTRGAFTDAHEARAGLFTEANEGTLFLDEIGEMPLGMQVKILRALEERKVRPLGATQEVKFDARIVTATNRDLKQEVDARRFRADLYYRINVVRIDVPPLRERDNDVLLLAQYFLERAAARSKKPVARLGRRVAERLIGYDWPGNVRELENCMERSVALARFDEITLDDLPSQLRESAPPEPPRPSERSGDLVPLHVIERRYIQEVLTACRGNKTVAARVLGFDRRTLYRKLERLDDRSSAAQEAW